MKEELRDKIYTAAPKLYHNEPDPVDVGHLSPRALARINGPVYFGVGDGWFDILLDLSVKLEAMEGVADVRVLQVKEKFGGLRFYISNATEEMLKTITIAEHQSYKVCETCGESGKLRRGGWMSVLCEKHKEVKHS